MCRARYKLLQLRLLSLLLALLVFAGSACEARGMGDMPTRPVERPIAPRSLPITPDELSEGSEAEEARYMVSESELVQLEASVMNLERLNAELATALAAANAKATAYKAGAVGCLCAVVAVAVASVALAKWR